MQIHITSQAWEKLMAAWPKEKVLRINGEVVGGCGMNVEYSLFWDERALHDQTTEIEGFPIHIDRETIEYLDTESLTIDYRANQGFKLVSPAQTLAYALSVKHRWE